MIVCWTSLPFIPYHQSIPLNRISSFWAVPNSFERVRPSFFCGSERVSSNGAADRPRENGFVQSHSSCPATIFNFQALGSSHSSPRKPWAREVRGLCLPCRGEVKHRAGNETVGTTSILSEVYRITRSRPGNCMTRCSIGQLGSLHRNRKCFLSGPACEES